jgi:hypothetical protein
MITTASAGITLPAGFELFPHQRKLIAAWESGHKLMIARWHRAAGKGICSLALMTIAAHEKPGVYLHVSASFRKARENQWDALDPATGRPYLDAIPPELIVSKNEAELSIDMRTKVPGRHSKLRWVTASDADDLRGLHPAGVVIDEFSTFEGPQALHTLRPVLTAANAWLLITSTPRGLNHFYQTWNAAEAAGNWWLSTETIRTTTKHDGVTPLIAETLLAQERAEGQLEEFLRQEYYVEWSSAVESSYFGDLLTKAQAEDRIGELPLRYDRGVIAALDLGISDPTSCVFVLPDGPWLCVVDYCELQGLGLVEALPKLHERGHNVTKWLAPHDAAQRDLGTGLSRVEVARRVGVRLEVVPRVSEKDLAIDALRRLLPRMRFDRRRCERLLLSLQSYSRIWDDRQKTFKDKPRHDWASHAVDALMCFATGWKELWRDDRTPRTQPQYARSSISAYGGGHSRDVWGDRR